MAFTNSRDPEIDAWFTKDDTVAYIQKQNVLYDELPRTLRKVLHQGAEPPQVFIVHGHDRTTLLELKNFLQNRLGLPSCISSPSNRVAVNIDREVREVRRRSGSCLCPPHSRRPPRRPSGFRYFQRAATPKRRLRVRVLPWVSSTSHSGRVFLLKKGEPEVPSDITGIVYVDITDGIEAAAESLRRELEEWL